MNYNNNEQNNNQTEKYQNRVKNIKKCVEIIVENFYSTNSISRTGMYDKIDDLYKYYYELSESDVELVKMLVNRMTK